mmetsp:Transcript_36684/g.114236  ORF Transcript_36684/g.114236 Transcript_36684/m.114236 type:complete len:234 (-) Transcript_36684:88-789(-)
MAALVGVPPARAISKESGKVLAEHGLWEGWSMTHDSIPLSSEEELALPKKQEQDLEVVGFAFPLPPVEYALRNERRYPPPSQEVMDKEMSRLLHHTLEQKLFNRCYVLSIIYSRINQNRRDSPGWQRAFVKAGGIAKLMEFWRDPEPGQEEGQPSMDRYWVMATLGRMMGTCTESRQRLLEDGIVDLVLEGAKDPDDMVQDCSVCALKGLIQHPEGRVVVTPNVLISCLSGRL